MQPSSETVLALTTLPGADVREFRDVFIWRQKGYIDVAELSLDGLLAAYTTLDKHSGERYAKKTINLTQVDRAGDNPTFRGDDHNTLTPIPEPLLPAIEVLGDELADIVAPLREKFTVVSGKIVLARVRAGTNYIESIPHADLSTESIERPRSTVSLMVAHPDDTLYLRSGYEVVMNSPDGFLNDIGDVYNHHTDRMTAEDWETHTGWLKAFSAGGSVHKRPEYPYIMGEDAMRRRVRVRLDLAEI